MSKPQKGVALYRLTLDGAFLTTNLYTMSNAKKFANRHNYHIPEPGDTPQPNDIKLEKIYDKVRVADYGTTLETNYFKVLA